MGQNGVQARTRLPAAQTGCQQHARCVDPLIGTGTGTCVDAVRLAARGDTSRVRIGLAAGPGQLPLPPVAKLARLTRPLVGHQALGEPEPLD